LQTINYKEKNSFLSMKSSLTEALFFKVPERREIMSAIIGVRWATAQPDALSRIPGMQSLLGKFVEK